MIDLDKQRQISVLLVDDDRICRQGVKRALKKEELNNPVYEAGNGIEALDLLRGTNGCTPIPRPYTILLDLNLPQMTGHEFLRELRADPELRAANVFVITTSVSKDDLEQSYARNAAGYVMKSGGPAPFSDLARMLAAYWAAVRLA